MGKVAVFIWFSSWELALTSFSPSSRLLLLVEKFHHPYRCPQNLSSTCVYLGTYGQVGMGNFQAQANGHWGISVKVDSKQFQKALVWVVCYVWGKGCFPLCCWNFDVNCFISIVAYSNKDYSLATLFCLFFFFLHSYWHHPSWISPFDYLTLDTVICHSFTHFSTIFHPFILASEMRRKMLVVDMMVLFGQWFLLACCSPYLFLNQAWESVCLFPWDGIHQR